MKQNDKKASQALECLEQVYAYYSQEDTPLIKQSSDYEDLPLAA